MSSHDNVYPHIELWRGHAQDYGSRHAPYVDLEHVFHPPLRHILFSWLWVLASAELFEC